MPHRRKTTKTHDDYPLTRSLMLAAQGVTETFSAFEPARRLIVRALLNMASLTLTLGV